MSLVSFGDFLNLYRVVYLPVGGVSLQDGLFQSRKKLLHNTYLYYRLWEEEADALLTSARSCPCSPTRLLPFLFVFAALESNLGPWVLPLDSTLKPSKT